MARGAKKRKQKNKTKVNDLRYLMKEHARNEEEKNKSQDTPRSDEEKDIPDILFVEDNVDKNTLFEDNEDLAVTKLIDSDDQVSDTTDIQCMCHCEHQAGNKLENNDTQKDIQHEANDINDEQKDNIVNNIEIKEMLVLKQNNHIGNHEHDNNYEVDLRKNRGEPTEVESDIMQQSVSTGTPISNFLNILIGKERLRQQLAYTYNNMTTTYNNMATLQSDVTRG
ncbi:hypothetical protein WDU94_000912, partial [Cyamophila willieti]